MSMWAIPALAEDVKVGAVYSIEGIFSAIGGPERDGALLAVDQLNQAGGVGGKHVDITIYDDGGDQAKAVQLANRLIFQDKVSAAFGPTVTPTGEMIAPVYEQNKMLEIGVVAQDYLWKDTQYIFMSIPTDAVLVEAMLNHAKKTGAKKIAIAYADVPYGVSGAKLIAPRGQECRCRDCWRHQMGRRRYRLHARGQSASCRQSRRYSGHGARARSPTHRSSKLYATRAT